MVERDFLSHLAERDPAVLRGLWRLRQRAYLEAGVPERDRRPAARPPRVWWTALRFPGDGLLFAVLISFFVTAAGLATIKLLWPALEQAVGVVLPFNLVAFAVALATWWLGRSRDRLSVKPVEPPDPEATQPLLELHDLAERSAHRLRQGYRAQLSLAVLVSAVLVGLIAFAGVIASMGYVRFGVMLGLSALLTASLVGLNWRPFHGAKQVHRLAEEANLAAARLGVSLASVERIADPEFRQRATWQQVAQSLVGLRRPTTL